MKLRRPRRILRTPVYEGWMDEGWRMGLGFFFFFFFMGLSHLAWAGGRSAELGGNLQLLLTLRFFVLLGLFKQ